jgi:hypothetical protein
MVRVLVWGTRGRRFESCLPDSRPIALQCSHVHAIAMESGDVRVPFRDLVRVLTVVRKPSNIDRRCVVARGAERVRSSVRDTANTTGPHTEPP